MEEEIEIEENVEIAESGNDSEIPKIEKTRAAKKRAKKKESKNVNGSKKSKEDLLLEAFIKKNEELEKYHENGVKLLVK